MNTPPRVLCIEDNPMNWRLVQRLLSQGGFESHWASEGLKGYDMALELRPDLILLDINLPGLSGFEIATKLRHARELEGSIIVALTAKTMSADRDTALVTGCDGFISKPIDPFRFLEQVNDYLAGRRDVIEADREGATLRQFSQQVVEHLEDQLRELQESNRKLLEAQGALELRNRQLSGLLDLSQALLPLHDPAGIQQKALQRAASELGLKRIALLRLHESGGFLEGLSLENGAFRELPPLATDHPLVKRLMDAGPSASPKPEALGRGATFDEGVPLGFWEMRDAAGLVPLWSRTETGQLWGLVPFSRTGGDPILPFEGELMALYGGLLRASLENASLISHLNESSRALGESFERIESAYLDLQRAQRALGLTERKVLLGDLFLKIALRLQSPVEGIRDHLKTLGRLVQDAPEIRDEALLSLDAIQGSVGQMDHLMRSMLRRAGQAQAGQPEWIDLHDLIYQELELLQAEGSLPADTKLRLELSSRRARVFGVYSDFAEAFGHFVVHASASGASPWVGVRTSDDREGLRLEISDEGGAISAELAAEAFQPFSLLRDQAKGRMPGAGLPSAAQHLTAYGAEPLMKATERGTCVLVHIPREDEPRTGSLS
ncbi:MAG TPA: response regulator [Holophagaceae bacterium]|jgi:CheY-like chemotaxis protein/signal transduction histidine kinase|nr:response regulator [Holophagaceae bacterium]